MTATIDRLEPATAGAGARQLDYREPEVRLAKLFDPDSVVALHGTDTSGVSAVRGSIEGAGGRVLHRRDPAGRRDWARRAAGHRRRHRGGGPRARPGVGLWHSGGARLAEGVEALDGVGRVFAAMIRASGRVPQISVVLGPAAGGAAYGPALTDIVVMAPDGRIFVTGPDVVGQ